MYRSNRRPKDKVTVGVYTFISTTVIVLCSDKSRHVDPFRGKTGDFWLCPFWRNYPDHMSSESSLSSKTSYLLSNYSVYSVSNRETIYTPFVRRDQYLISHLVTLILLSFCHSHGEVTNFSLSFIITLIKIC